MGYIAKDRIGSRTIIKILEMLQGLGITDPNLEQTVTTINNDWTDIETIPVLSGEAYTYGYTVTAERTDSDGYTVITGRGALANFGAGVVTDFSILSVDSIGGELLNVRVIGVGNEAKLQVRGRQAETWDWTARTYN